MSKVVKKDYLEEAVSGFNLRTALEEANRCIVCHDAPCSKSCPAGTDPARFIRALKFKNVKGAAETIRSNNPLGGSCAKVCPYDQLCQEACSRCGIDKPIQIGRLQNFIVEQEKAFDMKVCKAGEKKAGRVACVGAGPASLTVASKLAQAGYDVTVYEREAKAGGVLSHTISPARLPQDVVDYDISLIEDLGVKFVFNTEAKADILKDYDAVFAGTGLWSANVDSSFPGADLKGVYTAIDYLKEARKNNEAFDPGKRVVVVGGGDVAMDCASTAKTLGTEDVRILYRRSIEEAPADINEVLYITSLGIGMTTGFYPVAAKGNGKLETVEAAGFYDKDAKMSISADTLVFATGQKAEDQSGIAPFEITDKGLIAVDENGAAIEGFFAGGDVINGGKTVVEAVAEGKKAAEAIIAYLEKKGVK